MTTLSALTMKRLRFWIVVLILWLIFLFNIERLTVSIDIETIDIRSYTYVFVALVAAVMITLPNLRRLPLSVLVVVPIPIFLVLKGIIEEGRWNAILLEGNAFPLTVTQLSAIILTGLLARQINYALYEFEDVIADITFSYIGKLPKPFLQEQGTMYREVKRARRYQRPLAVVAVKVAEKDINVALPRMVKEVQAAMMREYVLARIARILRDNIYDLDTIALNDDHFVIVLPEIEADRVPAVAKRLEKAVKEKLDVQLNIGTASFPNEAVTFESLVELAVQNASQNEKVLQAQLRQSNQQAMT